MRVLITGVAGFIGAALARRLLERGDEVLGIDVVNDYYSPLLKRARLADISDRAERRFQCIERDFSDFDGLVAALDGQNFESIVHLGAQPGVRFSLTHPFAYAQSNLVGHLSILELARARQVRHMIYASSSSVYGGNAKLPFSVEDRVDHPVSLYAATKKADELMSETYAHLYRIPLTGLRFFTVYGPWGRPDMMPWIFTRKILDGEPIPVFNHGKSRRDFTFIDDIVDGVVAALDRPPADDGQIKAGGSTKSHAIYNIGNSRPEPLMRFIELLEQACGRSAKVELLPMQPGDVEQTYADIDAIQRDLGYAPSTLIEDGIPRFVEWFRRYHAV